LGEKHKPTNGNNPEKAKAWAFVLYLYGKPLRPTLRQLNRFGHFSEATTEGKHLSCDAQGCET
jgi:hypothetical protein